MARAMRELWFERAGVRLFASDFGAGELIVMLHGGMASHVAVLPLVTPLAPGYRIIAPDLRGSGRSRSGATLTFDHLFRDLEALLDHVGADEAVVGGLSGGAGVALGFALRFPERVSRLVLVQPVYAGEAIGYTEQQREAFEAMDALASRAPAEGVKVLQPLYEALPPDIRAGALAMLAGFDAASVAATSRWMVSGAQPFASQADLRALRMPTLLIRGDDPMHPASVSDLYAEQIPRCVSLPTSTPDVPGAIRSFLDEETSRCSS